MRILFTKGQSILSKTIRTLTKEPASHVALEFGWFVVHANLLGLHIETTHTFLKHSEVVYALQPVEASDDSEKLNSLLDKYESSWYDFGGLLFLGLCFSLRMIGIPMPKSNLWQSTGMFACTEWASTWEEGKEDSMITPYGLYLKLKAETDKWEDSK